MSKQTKKELEDQYKAWINHPNDYVELLSSYVIKANDCPVDNTTKEAPNKPGGRNWLLLTVFGIIMVWPVTIIFVMLLSMGYVTIAGLFN